MKVKTVVFCLFLAAQPLFLLAQEESNSRRWLKNHPWAEVVRKSGDTIQGQPIHFNMEEIILLPSDTLPLGMEGTLVSVPTSDIEWIYLDRGGTITMAQTAGIVLGIAAGTGFGLAVGSPVAALLLGNVFGVAGGFIGKGAHKNSSQEDIWFNPASLDYLEDLHKLHDWSVFPDSIIHSNDISKLADHSPAICRAFPLKKVRISFGVNSSFNTIEGDMESALDASGLPDWHQFRYTNLGLEFLDISLRLKKSWILGFGLMKAPEELSYADNFPGNSIGTFQGYNLGVDQTDYRFYAEYVFGPVDRFFTDHQELVVGGGFILSSCRSNFHYYYGTEVLVDSTVYWDTQSAGYYAEDRLLGFQLRASYHLYLIRGISLSAGMEANVYQNLKIPVLERPADLPGEGPILKAYTLNYSTIRLKLGLHFYF